MKENDYIVAALNNPTFSAGDFQNVLGMDLENTQFLSKDEYLKSPFILENEAFKDINGNFSEDKFDDFYNKVSQSFNQFVSEDYIDNFDYSVWDTERPVDADIKDVGLSISQIRNPDNTDFGVAAVNEYSNPELSKRELAQNNKIYDPETGTWSDKTLNEMSLFSNVRDYLGSLFDEPLVYAQYDEDTIETDPWTGEEVKHQKGEWKTDEWGNYYTEKLGGRSLIDRQVVSAFDYLTPENSSINKYDFFDSDDLEKSIGGNIMKNIAAIIPLFTPVAPYYTGLLVAREMIKTLPMAYGMVTGLLGSNDNDSKLANTLRAYGEKFTTSTSDYAQQNTFSFENFANLASEVANQWSQQRLIAQSFAKLSGGTDKVIEAQKMALTQYAKSSQQAFGEAFKGKAGFDKVFQAIGTDSPAGVAELIKTNKWINTPFGKAAIAKYVPAAEKIMQNRIRQGQDLSLAYMALVSNTDVYDTVKRKGGTGQEAAWITLGSTLGMFGVDKYLHLGEAFFSSDEARQAMRMAANQAADEIATPLLGKSRKELLQGGLNIGQKAVKYFNDMRHDFVNHTLGKNVRGFLGKAAGEGIEEVSEELAADLSKQLGQIAGQFGYASQTDYGAWENWFDRYAMNFLGGAVGGGIFYGVDVYQNRGRNAKELNNDMIYLIRNGKKDELISEIGKLKDKGQLASTKLSWHRNEQGAFLTAENDEGTQNNYVYNSLVSRVNEIDSILNEEGLNLSDDEIFNKMVQGEMRANRLRAFLSKDDKNGGIQKQSYITRYYDDVQELSNKIIAKNDELKALEKKVVDSDKSSNVKYKQDKEKLQNDIAELEKQRDFLFGEGSLNYVEKLLFAIDPDLLGQFVNYNKSTLSLYNFGKPYEELSGSEKESIDQAMKEQEKSNKIGIDKAFELYKQIQEKMNPMIQGFNDFRFSEEQLQEIKRLSSGQDYKKQDYDFKFEDETDEQYEHRNEKYENETDEEFDDRKKARKEKLDAYNLEQKKKIINESIKKLAELPADMSTLRAKLVALQGSTSAYLADYLERTLPYMFKFDGSEVTDTNNIISSVRKLILDQGIDANPSDLRDGIINIIATDLTENGTEFKKYKEEERQTILEGSAEDIEVAGGKVTGYGQTIPWILVQINNMSKAKKAEANIDPNYSWDEKDGIIKYRDIANVVKAIVYSQPDDTIYKINSVLLNEIKDVPDIGKRVEFILDNFNAVSWTLNEQLNDEVGRSPEGIPLSLKAYLADVNDALDINKKPVDDAIYTIDNDEKIQELARQKAEDYFDYGSFYTDNITVGEVNQEDAEIEELNLSANLQPLTDDNGTYHSIDYQGNTYRYSRDGNNVTILDENGQQVDENLFKTINDTVNLQYNTDNDTWTKKKQPTITTTVSIGGNDFDYRQIGKPDDASISVKLYDVDGNEISANSQYRDAQRLVNDAYSAVMKKIQGKVKFSPKEKVNQFYDALKKDDLIQNVSRLERAIATKPSTISDVIGSIWTEIRGEKKDLESVVGGIFDRFKKSGRYEFTLTGDEYDTLKKLEQDIDLTIAFILAASEDTSFNHPVGHNKMLNRFVERHKDVFKNYKTLPEIETKKAKYLINDAIAYKDLIKQLMHLHEINIGQKQRIFARAGVMLDKAHLEFFKKNKSIFESLGLFEGLDIDSLHGDTPYKDLILIEETVRYNFLKGDKKMSDVLEAFTSDAGAIDAKKVALQTTSKVDDKIVYKSLTDYDKFIYLVNVLAGDNKALYDTMLDITKSNPKFAPIAIQEFAGKVGNTAKINTALINEALDFIAKKADIPQSVLHNTIIVDGIAGAGKTTAVAQILVSKGDGTWISGPTDQQINGLKSVLSLAAERKMDDILKYILSDTEVQEFKQAIKNNEDPDKNKFFTTKKTEYGFSSVTIKPDLSLKPIDSKDKPKYIVIDEASHIDTPTVMLISKWAEQNDIQLILISDTTQNGNISGGKDNDGFYNIGREVVFAWRTPTLSVSLRDNNIQKFENIKTLSNIITNGDKNNSTEWLQQYNDWFTQGNLQEKLKLHYYQDGNNFYGDKVITSLGNGELDLIGSNDTIAYIGNTSDDEYKTLQNKFGNRLQIFTPIEIQGREFDYVIIGDKQVTFPDTANAAGNEANIARDTFLSIKNLYTLTTRARKGSYVLDKSGKLGTYIKNVQDNMTGNTSILDKIDKLRDLRLNTIQDIANIVDQFRKSHPLDENTIKTKGGSTVKTKSDTTTDSNKDEEEFVAFEDLDIIDLFEEEDPTDNNSNIIKSDLKINEDEKDDERKIATALNFVEGRCYVNGTHNGSVVIDSKRVWKNPSGGHEDLGIFLRKGTQISTNFDKSSLVRQLLYLKSFILFNHINQQDYDNADAFLKNLISLKSLQDIEWYVNVEPVGENNVLVGSSLDNKKRGIPESDQANAKRYVVTILAKFKNKNGTNCYVTMGDMADPKTWSDNAPKIKQAINNRINTLKQSQDADQNEIKRLEDYVKNLDDNIKKYTDNIKNLINECKNNKGKLRYKINKPKLYSFTSLVNLGFNKDGSKRKSRLQKLVSDDQLSKRGQTEWEVATQHTVMSDPVVLVNAKEYGLSSNLDGKTVIFVSSDMTLRKEDLPNLYLNQKNNPKTHTPVVRMIVLSNAGVTFSSLFAKNWAEVYRRIQPGTAKDYNSLRGIKTPFKPRAMGVRMFVAAWNFRADLQTFKWHYDQFKQKESLSDKKIENLCKLDSKKYNELSTQKGSYMSEDEYRKTLQTKDSTSYNKLKKLWDFNDNLGNVSTRFRLGHEEKFGVYVRRLTHLHDNEVYKPTKDRNGNDTYNVNGVYITPTMMLSYHNMANAIFTEFLDKLVTIEDVDTKSRIYIKDTESWFQQMQQKKNTVEVRIGSRNSKSIKKFTVPAPNAVAIKFLELGRYLTMSANAGMSLGKMGKIDLRTNKERDANEQEIKMDAEAIANAIVVSREGFSEDVPKLSSDNTGFYGVVETDFTDRTNNKKHYDLRATVFFNLMFHGMVVFSGDTYNDFEKLQHGTKTLQATDAPFKYGFFADPFLVSSGGKSGAANKSNTPYAQAIVNKALLFTDTIPTLGYLGVDLSFEHAETAEPELDTSKPEEKKPAKKRQSKKKGQGGGTVILTGDETIGSEEGKKVYQELQSKLNELKITDIVVSNNIKLSNLANNVSLQLLAKMSKNNDQSSTIHPYKITVDLSKPEGQRITLHYLWELIDGYTYNENDKFEDGSNEYSGLAFLITSGDRIRIFNVKISNNSVTVTEKKKEINERSTKEEYVNELKQELKNMFVEDNIINQLFENITTDNSAVTEDFIERLSDQMNNIISEITDDDLAKKILELYDTYSQKCNFDQDYDIPF